MDETQNSMNSTKTSMMHTRWIGHLYSLEPKLSLAAGKSSWAPLRPLPKASGPHCTCHLWLPSSGKGCAQHKARQSLLAWAGSARGSAAARRRRAPSMANCAASSASSASSPLSSPTSSTNKLFRKILLCKEWCQVTCLVNCVTLDN